MFKKKEKKIGATLRGLVRTPPTLQRLPLSSHSHKTFKADTDSMSLIHLESLQSTIPTPPTLFSFPREKNGPFPMKNHFFVMSCHHYPNRRHTQEEIDVLPKNSLLAFQRLICVLRHVCLICVHILSSFSLTLTPFYFLVI